jgi:hypothetical protein
MAEIHLTDKFIHAKQESSMPWVRGKSIYERAKDGKKGSYPVITTLLHGKEVVVQQYPMEGG